MVKEKIKDEIITLILIMILDFVYFGLTFNCYFVYKTNNLNCIVGSLGLLAMICTTTVIGCKLRQIYKIIDDELISIETIE